ncbi:nucleotidyltransferase domain-containing protein [Gimesia panareensis]|uniref:nucleotidyltransferase domain-containing protein n=1 Tax=Gimesia panareensis TaxID=2527978 RepID=UPI00118B0E45|nr:nucleotidyltransferase domain-containing protein [Gimesia panareensis]QDU52156.1 Nucleotidyltransferase domain protein [Gimesia panareensis]
MDQETAIKSFVEKAVQRFKPQAIYLFGSRARGDNLLHSDYDFIVVSKEFEKLKWLYRIYALVKFWKADENIDVLPYTPTEFEDKKINSSTVRSAMKDAKLVYGKQIRAV